MAENECRRFLGEYFVSVAAIGGAKRLYVNHTRLGKHSRTTLLREVQIVHVERVLGTVAASHHAAAATLASSAVRTFTAEVRIGNGNAALYTLWCLEDGDMSAIKRVADSGRLSNLSKQFVGRPKDLVFSDTQHS